MEKNFFSLQIHSVSDSEEEENKLVYPVKQEPTSPGRSQHSSKKHRDKNLDNAKERHRVKELSRDNRIGSENGDHIRIKSEPMEDEKHHKHKSHKSKKHEKSSSSTSRDKHSSSRHSHSDHKSSRREGKERKDGDGFNSTVSDVDLSIVKSEAEEERKKLKMKMKKKEENDRNDTSNVDLSLVKKEKLESTSEKHKESTLSKHKSKERHSKDMPETKIRNKVSDEWAENIHVKQERVDSECDQGLAKDHSERDSLKDKSKEKQKGNEQKRTNDRKSNDDHKNKGIKVKTEEVESSKKDQLVRADPEFDNHGISFEDMLMSGVTKVKKKKPTSSSTGHKSTKSEVCPTRWVPACYE